MTRGLPAGAHVLVVKLSSLGDLFHALPAVHRLREAAGATVDWVVQPEYADVVRCFPDVRRVLPFPRRGGWRELAAFRCALREVSYAAAIDFQGLLKSALVTRAARARLRIGPSFHREGARLLYDAVAGRRDKCRHAVDENMDVLRYLAIEPGTPEFPVRFPPRPRPEPAPRVAILPVSRWPAKNWPVESFAAVARALQEKAGASVFLVGGPDNVEAADFIARALPRPPVNVAGRLSLVESGSLLAEMQLLLSNDTGPMHMAAALGVPVLAVFGPTDARRTGPFGPGHRVMLRDLPCMPCFERQCRLGDTRCLRGLAAEDVVRAVLEMLSAAVRDPGPRFRS